MTAPSAAVRYGSPELVALLNRIAEGAERRERELIPPREPIGWIKEAGLGRLRVPIAEGGGGATARQFFETLIALAEADSNVAHILRTHFWFVEQQLQSADPASRARGLALLNADALVGNAVSEQGRRPAGLQFDTVFTADGDGYRLNGAKFYSTGSLYSDYTQIWAAAPGGRIAAAVIPVGREGVAIEEDWDGFGQRLTGTGATRLNNVRIEFERVRGSWRSIRTATPELSRRVPPALPPGRHRGCATQRAQRRRGLGQAPGA